MTIPRSFCAVFVLLLTTLTGSPAAGAGTDTPGSKDHPMFSRLPGYYISDYSQEEFAKGDFADETGADVTVEGQKTTITYSLSEGKQSQGTLKIIRNFSNAVQKIGGKSYEYTDHTVFLNVKKEGREVWAEVVAGDEYYTLTIVQKGEVKQEISADWMLEELNRSGHVALYINFDTGKAVIRPESKPIIEQIVALLLAHSALKLKIEGHTDNVGADDANLKLSDQRAKAVLAAITAGGIDAKRLTAVGLGETKPIADNAGEAGRAKNRRVELVKL